MNTLHDKECQYCGSTLYRRAGSPHCSGDNLPETRAIFDLHLSFEQTNPAEFNRRVDSLSINSYNYDLFVDYWTRKKTDPYASIKCLHEDTYFRDIHAQAGQLPTPAPYIPFPDLAEVYIAEIMLGRELTPLEKDGSRFIPKIDQETGAEYFAPLTWVRWPHSYISLKDMTIKTDYTEPPLRVVFDMEAIRGKYAGRSGEGRDE